MQALYDLKDMLCKELEEYGKKGELSAGTLDIVDKLTHTIKNLDKIIEVYEDGGYSNYGGPYYNGIYNKGRSYSRMRRDSMGRYSGENYSRNSNMVDQLRQLMTEAPDERTRQEMQNMISRMEIM